SAAPSCRRVGHPTPPAEAAVDSRPASALWLRDNLRLDRSRCPSLDRAQARRPRGLGAGPVRPPPNRRRWSHGPETGLNRSEVGRATPEKPVLPPERPARYDEFSGAVAKW